MIVRTTARHQGHPGYSATMPCTVESAEPARNLIRTALGTWGLDTLADDGALIVTELVANAAQHTDGPNIRVSVSRPAPGSVRIDVVDRSSKPPVRREAGEVDERGRGLLLVAVLTQRWGIDSLPWGKRVWGLLTSKEEQ